MSKFKKKKKGMPGISTASLPDIVFMLLFFFMVTTVMRETELKIKKPTLPKATEIKKLERKSLVSYIYVGKVKDQNGDKIQLNDRILSVDDQDVRELKAFHISKILASKNQNSARKIVVSRGTIV